MISGAAFNVILELNKFIGEFKIFVDLCSFIDFSFINFFHFFFDSLQIVYFLQSIKYACISILLHLCYRINGLHFVFNSIMIEKSQQKLYLFFFWKFPFCLIQQMYDKFICFKFYFVNIFSFYQAKLVTWAYLLLALFFMIVNIPEQICSILSDRNAFNKHNQVNDVLFEYFNILNREKSRSLYFPMFPKNNPITKLLD